VAVVLSVAHMAAKGGGEELIRIVSARKATARYHKAERAGHRSHGATLEEIGGMPDQTYI